MVPSLPQQTDTGSKVRQKRQNANFQYKSCGASQEKQESVRL
jgi:hypothetical protein